MKSVFQWVWKLALRVTIAIVVSCGAYLGFHYIMKNHPDKVAEVIGEEYTQLLTDAPVGISPDRILAHLPEKEKVLEKWDQYYQLANQYTQDGWVKAQDAYQVAIDGWNETWNAPENSEPNSVSKPESATKPVAQKSANKETHMDRLVKRVHKKQTARMDKAFELLE